MRLSSTRSRLGLVTFALISWNLGCATSSPNRAQRSPSAEDPPKFKWSESAKKCVDDAGVEGINFQSELGPCAQIYANVLSDGTHLGLDLRGARLDGEIKNARISIAQSEGLKLGVELLNSTIEDSDLTRAKYNRIKLNRSRIVRSQFDKSQVTIEARNSSAIEASSFVGAKVSGTFLDVTVTDSDFSDSKFGYTEYEGITSRLFNTAAKIGVGAKFESTDFRGATLLAEIDIHDRSPVRTERPRFFKCRFDDADLRESNDLDLVVSIFRENQPSDRFHIRPDFSGSTSNARTRFPRFLAKSRDRIALGFAQ